MSIIAAGTTTTTALSSTGNTDGTIQLQVNGTTPSVTLNALGAVGVGAVPNFGTSGQALVSAGSTAAPTWANVTTSPAGTTGQVQINNAGAFGAVGSGTSGQVLTSQGAGAAPVFSTISSGALVYLSTVTASNSAEVDLETTFNSTYRAYLIVGTGILCSAASVLFSRLKIGGDYITSSSYGFHRHDLTSNSSAYTASSSSGGTVISMCPQLSSERSANFVMTVYFPSDTANEKMVDWRFAPGRGSNNISTGSSGYASNSNTAALTGVRFFFNNGNIVSGEFRLYGIANS